MFLKEKVGREIYAGLAKGFVVLGKGDWWLD